MPIVFMSFSDMVFWFILNAFIICFEETSESSMWNWGTMFTTQHLQSRTQFLAPLPLIRTFNFHHAGARLAKYRWQITLRGSNAVPLHPVGTGLVGMGEPVWHSPKTKLSVDVLRVTKDDGVKSAKWKQEDQWDSVLAQFWQSACVSLSS